MDRRTQDRPRGGKAIRLMLMSLRLGMTGSQNISLALGIKTVFVVLALFGSATMWMAVFADMGATLIVVANGLRRMRAGGTKS